MIKDGKSKGVSSDFCVQKKTQTTSPALGKDCRLQIAVVVVVVVVAVAVVVVVVVVVVVAVVVIVVVAVVAVVAALVSKLLWWL